MEDPVGVAEGGTAALRTQDHFGAVLRQCLRDNGSQAALDVCEEAGDDRQPASRRSTEFAETSQGRGASEAGRDVDGSYILVSAPQSFEVDAREALKCLSHAERVALVDAAATRIVRGSAYSGRARAALKAAVAKLGLDWADVLYIEQQLAQQERPKSLTMMLSGSTTAPRLLSVGLAAIGGGLLLFYTGGMAAAALSTAAAEFSFVASATGTMVSAANVATSVAAGIPSLFGAAGATVAGYKMHRRVRCVSHFQLVGLHERSPIRAPRTASQEPDNDDLLERLDEELDVRKIESAAQEEGCAVRSATAQGLARYIFVPGGIARGVDPRVIFGGLGAAVAEPGGKARPRKGSGGARGPEAPEGAAGAPEGPALFQAPAVPLPDPWEHSAELALATSGAAAEAEEDGGGSPQRSPGGPGASQGEGWDRVAARPAGPLGWWRDQVPAGDESVLVWEPEALSDLHEAMESLWTDAGMKGVRFLVEEAMKKSAITAPFALPVALLERANALDNPWTVVTNRAKEAGVMLARALLFTHTGKSPVTLVGFSMGARVIMYCLRELAATAKRAGEGTVQAKARDIVENAVLLGAPVSTRTANWAAAREVVGGRLVNGYSERDWMLQSVYRMECFKLKVAGVSPVSVEGVENVDLSDLIGAHLDYAPAMQAICERLNLEPRRAGA